MAKKGVSSVPPPSSSTSSSSSGISTTKTTTTTTPTKSTKSSSSNTSLIQKPPFSLCHPGPSLSSSPSTFADAFEGVARLLQGRKNIVVLVGAGISVSCGIPDFRSKGSGLYSTLDIEGLGLSCPEELFDWEFFQEDPVPFFKFARNLYFPLGGGGGDGDTTTTKKVEPSDSHKLLALLEQKKMLLRVYSQNIDGLETVAGVSPKRMVYAHGSLQWATCCKCQRKVSSKEILPAIQQGTVPRCQAERYRGSSKSKPMTPTVAASSATLPLPTATSPSPSSMSRRSHTTVTVSSPPSSTTVPCELSSPRRGQKRPRANSRTSSSNTGTNTSTDDMVDERRVCGGVFKPAVTFFGETLNDNVRRALEADKKKVDALIVIGTSLSVAPISKVIEYLPSNIPRILINRAIVHPSSSSGDIANDDDTDENDREFRTNYVFDAYLLGFCDDVTRAIAKQLFKKQRQPIKGGSSGGGIGGVGKDVPRSTSSGGGGGGNTNSNESPDRHQPDCGGKLLTSVLRDGNDEYFDVKDWSDVVIPSERVLLFPGALPPSTKEDKNKNGIGGGGAMAATELTYCEIAHCDGCSKRIFGMIRKCGICFDYDLCSKCYPKLHKTHYDGKHVFNSEPAAAF